jgi:adenylosuccinate synthase
MFLQEKSRVEIGVISTGPERNQTIRRRANLLDV